MLLVCTLCLFVPIIMHIIVHIMRMRANAYAYYCADYAYYCACYAY